MLKRINLNIKLFKDYFKASCGVVFGIASAGLLFLDKSDLKIDTICKEIGALVVLLVGAFICAGIGVFAYAKIDNIKDKLILRYGDLWEIAFSRKGNKKIIVVNVNTTFDTIVDENLSFIDKPLVSPITIHGQWIKQMNKRNVSIEDIDEGIEKSLRLQKTEPIKIIDRSAKERGKLKCYKRGTIACYEYENTVFYLLALSEFDENNNAQNTKEELVQTITKLIDFYDQHGNGLDIYVPLMGTGQSRTGLSKEESLEVTTSLFRLYKEKIHGCANIIVYSKDRDKVSLGG